MKLEPASFFKWGIITALFGLVPQDALGVIGLILIMVGVALELIQRHNRNQS